MESILIANLMNFTELNWSMIHIQYSMFWYSKIELKWRKINMYFRLNHMEYIQYLNTVRTCVFECRILYMSEYIFILSTYITIQHIKIPHHYFVIQICLSLWLQCGYHNATYNMIREKRNMMQMGTKPYSFTPLRNETFTQTMGLELFE